MDTIKIAILSLVFCGFTLTGCKSGESDEYRSEETVILVIASKNPVNKESLYQWSGDTSWRPVFIYKTGAGNWSIWSAWSPIKGFEEIYEEGYEYVISVSHRVLAAPPLDANPDQYRLEEVLSKEKKDSEGIPENFITK